MARVSPLRTTENGAARCLWIERRKATGTRVSVGRGEGPASWIADARADIATSTQMDPKVLFADDGCALAFE